MITTRWGAAVAASALLLGLAGAPPAAASGLPPVHHVWIIQLENKSAAAVGADPYLGHTLPALGQLLTGYDAIGHQSLDNYIAEISGQAPNPVTQDDCPVYGDVVPGTVAGGQAVGAGCVYPAAVPTLADQLAAKGLTWRAYMGDMGNDPARDHTDARGDCGHPVLGTQDGTQTAVPGDQYATRHDPFVYFHSIIDDPARCDDVVPLTRLSAELAAPPSFSWITPDLCDDGHDATCAGTNLAGTHAGGVEATGLFLQRYVPMITASAAFRHDGLLVVTWDESAVSDSAACCGETPGPGSPLPGITGPGGGHVAAIVISPFTRAGTANPTPYNHYALLRTVEDLFGLDHLGEAGAAGLRAFGPDVFDAATVPAGASASTTAAPSAPAPPPAPALPVTGGHRGAWWAVGGLGLGLAAVRLTRARGS